MKRFLTLLLVPVLLCGCAKKQTAAPEELNTTAASPAVSAVQENYAAQVAEVYQSVLLQEGSTISLEELGVGDMTLELTLGVSKEFLDTSYRWSAAAKADWEELLASPERGYLLAMSAPDGCTAIRCCSGGDIVMVEKNREVTYLRAEGTEGTRLFESLFVMMVDALDAAIWNVTADGSLSPQAAAEKMVETIAFLYRTVPDWVEWKPLDVQSDGAEVYDIYYGEPEQFCANFYFRVQVEDVTSAKYGYWQAGSGLGEPSEEGYAYSSQVLVTKNEEGDWALMSRGSGGYHVVLPRKEGEDNLSLLVGDFFLTEGESHDWIIPYTILNRSARELAQLPEILALRGEKQAKTLCEALGKVWRENDFWPWTEAELNAALGRYAAYLG